MKQYQSFKEIETDLKRLNLERKIALEELKLLKSGVKEDLKPANWLSSILGMLGKYGIYQLIKKFTKK